MTQKQLYDVICDIADDEGMTPAEYVLSLVKNRNDKKVSDADALPDDLKKQYYSAEKAKSDARKIKKSERDSKEMKEDIALFRQYFPDVSPDQVPDAVWAQAAKGIPLAYAYALYLTIKSEEDARADSVNRENGDRAAPVGNDMSELPYTREQVEGMSPKAVKGNYRKIVDSIKNWKF